MLEHAVSTTILVAALLEHLDESASAHALICIRRMLVRGLKAAVGIFFVIIILCFPLVD